MVVSDDFLYLLGVGVVDLGDTSEQIHDDLDVLNLLARLNFAVFGETVLVGEDGLGVFGHHHHAYLVLDELEVELS